MKTNRYRNIGIGIFALATAQLVGCANVERSMIFATGTTLGVDISTEAGTPYPVKFVVGYRRAEILVDPVMNGSISRDSSNANITQESHSVLAKLTGRIDGGGGGPQVNGGQWFAAGQAAIELAKHEATAAALSSAPDQVAMAIRSERVATEFIELDPVESALYFESIYNFMVARGSASGSDDAKARGFSNQLDQFAKSFIEGTTAINLYDFSSTRNLVRLQAVDSHQVAGSSNEFSQLMAMWGQLIASRSELQEVLAAQQAFVSTGNNRPTLVAPLKDPSSDQNTEVSNIQAEIRKHETLIQIIEHSVSSEDAVRQSRDYFQEITR